MLWRRALCNNQVFSFSYEGLSNEMDVPSCEVERAENCKVKRSMGVLDLHPDSSALSVSPILGYSCKYFFRYSFVQFASCEFSGRRYNDCMSGDWGGVLQVNLSQESTALCSAVYSAWSSCKMNISLSFVAAIFASIHSGETCICIFF